MISGLSLSEILQRLNANQLSSAELIEHYLKNIETLNPQYNAYLFVSKREELLSRAHEADEERKQGSSKKLLGIPFAVKDSFMAKGTPTTAGDKYLEGEMSQYNATIVDKLLSEGAILVGKTNMDSWGFGGSTENSAYGVTRNPFDKDRVAGGSSGGSAAALALDMCAFSIGEDTGGSIRNPASYCGVFGLKPTYGRISRFGCIAYASSLDTVGLFCRSTVDMQLLFEILEGNDGKDMTYERYSNRSLASKKFAYSYDFIPEGVNTDIARIYKETIDKFKSLGYQGIEIKFPMLDILIPVYYITAMSEASTNLARFDGTRYGKLFREIEGSDYDFKKFGINAWEDLFTKARTEGFTREAKRRVILGSFVLSEGYIDAYYKKAQIMRNKLTEEINDILKDADFLLSPVTPSSAPNIGSKITNPVEMYLEDIYTVIANLAGIPAIAFPAGKDKYGLPIGMQIMGKKGDDEKLIKILDNWEKQMQLSNY